MDFGTVSAAAIAFIRVVKGLSHDVVVALVDLKVELEGGFLHQY